MKMKSEVYDILKQIMQYWLPAINILYFALVKIWNLPYGVEVIGTISAIEAALGTILGISSSQWYKEDFDDRS